MSRNSFPAFTILSAERPEYTTEVNAVRTEQMREQLAARGLDFAASRGAYKGRQEANYIVLGDDDSHEFYMVLSLARRYGQDSVLHVDTNRGATLVYLTTVPQTRIPLGSFRAVTLDVAQASLSYTELNGLYYAAA